MGQWGKFDGNITKICQRVSTHHLALQRGFDDAPGTPSDPLLSTSLANLLRHLIEFKALAYNFTPLVSKNISPTPAFNGPGLNKSAMVIGFF